MIIQQSLKVCWNNLVFNETHHKTWFWSLFLNGGVSPQEKHHKRGMTKRWYVRTMRRFALICKDQNCPAWRVCKDRPSLLRSSSQSYVECFYLKKDYFAEEYPPWEKLCLGGRSGQLLPAGGKKFNTQTHISPCTQRNPTKLDSILFRMFLLIL